MQPPASASPGSASPASASPASANSPQHIEGDRSEVKHGAIGHLSADEELQQTVCEALIADVALDSSDIRVRAAQDTVVLSGSVASNDARRRALHIAKAQRGVTRVQADELSIRNA